MARMGRRTSAHGQKSDNPTHEYKSFVFQLEDANEESGEFSGYGKPYQAAPYRQPKAENRHRRPFAGVYGFSQLRRDKSRRYNGKGT